MGGKRARSAARLARDNAIEATSRALRERSAGPSEALQNVSNLLRTRVGYKFAHPQAQAAQDQIGVVRRADPDDRYARGDLRRQLHSVFPVRGNIQEADVAAILVGQRGDRSRRGVLV